MAAFCGVAQSPAAGLRSVSIGPGCRTDRDDAAAIVHLLERGLRGDEDTPDIEIDHLIQFLQRGLLELLGDRGPRIVNEHIELAERTDRFLDRGLYCPGIGGIRLDRDCLAARALDRLDDGGRGIRAPAVGDRHPGAVSGEPLGDGRTDSTRSAGDECSLAFEFL